MRKTAIISMYLAAFSVVSARAGERLGLGAYIDQVAAGNAGVKAAAESGSAGLERAEEADLMLAPTFFTSFSATDDQKPQSSSFFPYTDLLSAQASAGFSQLTSFGLQAKLSYNVGYVNYLGANLSSLSAFSSAKISIASLIATTWPELDLTQSLWGNGFGRATRAARDASEAQALASGYGARYQWRATLIDAETAYWNLAFSRMAVAVQSDAVERATKIHEWSSRRAKLHLADESDALQSKALLELKKLDLQSAVDNQRSAALAFNSARGIDSQDVPEQLDELTPETIEKLDAPARAPLRDDVLAAREQSRAAQGNAVAARERDTPTLDIFTHLALTGSNLPGPLNAGASPTNDPFSASFPTVTVGLQFQTPLDIGAVSKAREGWAREREASELSFERKLFEQEQMWKDLTRKLAESKKRFELARSLENIQHDKLTHERERLSRGRTTTYQVLMFEQDYDNSQLGRIQAQAAILGVVAQMKLYAQDERTQP